MEYIVISALGEYQPHLAYELTRLGSNCECNVVNCKITKFGTEFIANLMFAGSWNAIAKLETQLSQLEKKLHVHIISKRTNVKEYANDTVPYVAYIIAKDKPDVLFQVTNFFNEQGIPIEDLYAEIFAIRQTGAKMINLSLTINLSLDLPIGDFRERFILFCDGYNFDGMLEIEKH